MEKKLWKVEEGQSQQCKSNISMTTVASVQTHSSITVHGGAASLPVTFTVGRNVVFNQKTLI